MVLSSASHAGQPEVGLKPKDGHCCAPPGQRSGAETGARTLAWTHNCHGTKTEVILDTAGIL